MHWVAAACLSCLCFCAAAFGTFVPLDHPDGIEYLFAWPGDARLLITSAVASAAIGLLYFLVIARTRRQQPARLDEARSGRWLAPLVLLGAVVIGVLPAAPGVGERAAPIAYFLYDLRWWWFGAIVVWTAVRADRLIGEPVRRRLRAVMHWPEPDRLLLLDAVLFLGVMVSATLSSPFMRFDPNPHGDEPRYVRYCEVWYQGGGFEISGKKRFSEIPLDAPPQVHRIVPLFFRALAEEARTFPADVRGFLMDPSGFRWNRATGEAAFVTGKRGGVYQIYQPGVSLLLFPGYFIDRYFLGFHPNITDEFPSDLTMTNMAMLVMYGLCAVALFRLLRHALASDALAFAWAAIGMLTLPTAAFAFQLYPEVPALLGVLLLMTYVAFRAPDADWMTAAGAGGLAAGLAWFHPRFLLISLLFAATGFARTRNRSRPLFLGAACFVYLLLGGYAYRITGSVLPNAVWAAQTAVPALDLTGVPAGLLGYAIHRTWGLVPHAPVMFAAVAGLAVLAGTSPWRALLILTAGLALAATAAGHTLHASGSTPGRLIVAIVPLLIWPVALAVRRYWSSVAVRTATVVALIVSVESAISYNLNHFETFGAIRTMGLSGWRLNLAFPLTAGDWNDSPGNIMLLVVATGVIVLMAILPVLRRPGTDSDRRPIKGSAHWVSAAVVVMAIGVPAVATATHGQWTSPQYRIDERTARRRAAERLVDLDCRVCFTNRQHAVDWRLLDYNPAHSVRAEVFTQRGQATINVSVPGDERSPGFGRVRVDFGDSSSTSWMGIVDRRTLVHTYERPGEYSLTVWLQLRNGDLRMDRRTVSVTPGL